MSRKNLNKGLKLLFVLGIGAYIVYSLYIQLEYRNYIRQSIERNYQMLSDISNIGDNLTDRLSSFVQLSIEQSESSVEVTDELFTNWRVVNAESRNIDNYTSIISTLHTGDLETDWSLIQYSLFRVNGFIQGMTDKFLEHQAYVVSDEEYEKMNAVISIYRTISEMVKDESVDLEALLKSIKEPMLVIDDLYQQTLESVGKDD